MGADWDTRDRRAIGAASFVIIVMVMVHHHLGGRLNGKEGLIIRWRAVMNGRGYGWECMTDMMTKEGRNGMD